MAERMDTYMQNPHRSYKARCLQTLALTFSCAIIILLLPIKSLATINIIAAENFYGSIAQQLGGKYVSTDSILQNPNEDPHTFSADPSVAKKIAEADIVVYNGLGYDEWMKRLLSTKGKKGRQIIIVSELIGASNGENPHIWYEPSTMQVYANALSQKLIQLDPIHESYYELQLLHFHHEQQAFMGYIKYLKQQLAGTPVTATEPLFNYMATALGLKVLNIGFQMSMMNEMPPSPSEIKQMLSDLQSHRVKLLIYNTQTTDPTTENIKDKARENKIPVIGVTETQPPNMSYYEWMHSQLTQIAGAL